MNIKRLLFIAATLLGFAATVPAQAFLITTAAEVGPGARVQTFADMAGYDTSLPRVQIGASLGVDLGVQGVNGTLLFGAPFGAWSLGSNGEWTSAVNFVGIDGAGDPSNNVFPSLMFDFGGKTVQSVGAFMNFDPDFVFGPPGSTFPLPLYIAAYGVNGDLLESYELPLFTAGEINAGSFFGISLGSALISRFEVSGPYAVLRDFTFSAPVPEPSTYAMLLVGLMVLGALARRRTGHAG